MEKKRTYVATLITTLLGVVTACISIYLSYVNSKSALEIPIRATQTAEARATAFAQETVTTSISLSPTPSSTPTPKINTQTPHTPVPQGLETQVAVLQNQVGTLESMVTKQASSNNQSLEIETLNKNQESLDKRLAIMEKIILDSPEKSLELTFMRNEIDDLKASYKSDSERTLKEIERVYSQNNWFIGLMFTMAIGLISLAISNFIKKPEKTDENKQPTSRPKSRSK